MATLRDLLLLKRRVLQQDMDGIGAKLARLERERRSIATERGRMMVDLDSASERFAELARLDSFDAGFHRREAPTRTALLAEQAAKLRAAIELDATLRKL